MYVKERHASDIDIAAGYVVSYEKWNCFKFRSNYNKHVIVITVPSNWDMSKNFDIWKNNFSRLIFKLFIWNSLTEISFAVKNVQQWNQELQSKWWEICFDRSRQNYFIRDNLNFYTDFEFAFFHVLAPDPNRPDVKE